jgi:hypothetical protein
MRRRMTAWVAARVAAVALVVTGCGDPEARFVGLWRGTIDSSDALAPLRGRSIELEIAANDDDLLFTMTARLDGAPEGLFVKDAQVFYSVNDEMSGSRDNERGGLVMSASLTYLELEDPPGSLLLRHAIGGSVDDSLEEQEDHVRRTNLLTAALAKE